MLKSKEAYFMEWLILNNLISKYMKYKKQLVNELWINKRNEILERDSHKCVICGCKDNLQVHHKKYIYGRMAWEYDNDDLITLCKGCHYKVHDIAPIEDCISSKNFVIYRNAIIDKKLTPNERIIYSILCAFAVYKKDDLTDGWYEYKIENIRQFCRDLNITRQTFYRAQESLNDKNLLRGNYVYISNDFIKSGFIKLCGYEKIGGCLLIFYSYLRDRASKFGGSIDTYRRKLAEIFNVNICSIDKYLAKLHKLELVKRLDNGKLLIL